MSSSIPEYDFTPLPLQNQNNTQKIIIQVDPNSPGGQNMTNIQNNMAQNNANTQFDTIKTNDVKPLNGGKKDNSKKQIDYTIEYKGRKFKIYQNERMDEDKIIKEFMKKQNFKNDQFVSCFDHKKKEKTLYHIKDTKNLKIRKLYS
jgi:hypothetical protein